MAALDLYLASLSNGSFVAHLALAALAVTLTPFATADLIGHARAARQAGRARS